MPRKKSTHIAEPVVAGLRLRAARERAGMSQRGLAFPGCSAAYISRIEAGERVASPQVLNELAQRLRVNYAYLIGASDVLAASVLDDAEIALRLDEMDEAARLFQGALDEARENRERARALEGLGQVAFRRGDPLRAVELFEQALSVVDDDIAERPALASSLARGYAALGQLARSIAILERCTEACERDPVQYIRFAGMLGAALTDNGNFAEAERVLAAALTRSRGVADPYTRARLYWSESRLRREQGQSDLAASNGRRALEILRATEDTHAIALALQSLAYIYLDLDRPAEALDLLREGKPFIAATGTPLELAQYKVEEARALAALGEAEAAGALAMQVTNELGDAHPVDAGRSYALLGEIFADLGDPARAREVLELAVELLEQQAPGRYLVQAYKRLAALLKEQGDTDEAFRVLERALGIHERVGRPIA
jgi:tetratricopeptide (TPR) repeat protein